MSTMMPYIPEGKPIGVIIPRFIMDMKISLGAKFMYAILCKYAYRKDHCWPSQTTLAHDLGCSLSSVKNYLSELIRHDLIRVIRRHHAVYFLMAPESVVSHRPVHDQMDLETQQPNIAEQQPKFGYEKEIRNIQEKDSPLPPRQLDTFSSNSGQKRGQGCVVPSFADFESLWALYPKKEAKGLARGVWSKLVRSGQLPPLRSLKEAIQRFSGSAAWQKEDGRYVPYLCNWLKGQRWLDEDRSTVAPVLTPEEKAHKEQERLLHKYLEDQESQRVSAAKAEADRLRPVFESFLSRFSDAQRFRGPAWGYWSLLHRKGRILSEHSVPHDNELGIMQFLQAAAV